MDCAKSQIPGAFQKNTKNAGRHILARSEIPLLFFLYTKFLAGGEIPIKMMTRRNDEVIWKKYGVSLEISPKADVSGDMSIGIQSEISTIDPSQSVEGIPGFLTNRIRSHFDLKGSRTIVLSGLLKEEWSRDGAGVPFLSRIPILGPLFASQDYRNHKSELVVFVTPKVITDPANIPVLPMPKGWKSEH